MIWYFILALFWTSAVLYIIGLVVGIFKYEHTDTNIQFNEEQIIDEETPEKQQEQQLVKNYEETPRVNMESMF